MRLRSTLSWLDRRMRTAVSTTRVSPRMPSVSCEFEWFLIVPAHPPLPPFCPVLLLQPLSSTSCLCKGADHRTRADPMVSRHPLTDSCTTKGSGGTKKDYAISISEPFSLGFFFFLSKWCCFFFFLPSSSTSESSPPIVHLSIP